MGLSEIFALITGLAMFMFGMSAMGDGLKEVAGNKLETILWRLSSTPLKGVALGTVVTAVIQSSSATSIMVVGFVNSGIMTIIQAIGIIMGANIGTTATGWLLSLSSVNGVGEAWWTEFLSTASICAIFALIGIILKMFAKKPVYKHTGNIMLGFAVLMSGMKMMSGSMEAIKDSGIFADMMTTFQNPIIGILAGTLITAILQSTSATVGILQALSVTGVISNATAIPLIIGMCIGAAMPVLLSAIGATTNGKRASLIYLVFNIIGSIVLTPLFYGMDSLFHFTFMNETATAVSIALFNTLFHVAETILLLPFVKLLEKIVCFIVRDKQDDDQTVNLLNRLEERFLSHPSVAIEQSRAVLFAMAEKSENNLVRSIELLSNYNDEDYNTIQKKEETIDKYEDKLGSYFVQITGLGLNKEQGREVSKFLHTIGDFERIADHAVNISIVAKEMHEKGLEFSFEANRELELLSKAVMEIVALSVSSFKDNNTVSANRVEPLEETIDMLCDELKLRHIRRVQNGNCTLNQGFVFSDLITNYERIADHCSNIAVALIELSQDTYDTHAYLSNLKEHKSYEFNTYYEEYQKKYAL